LGMYLIRTGWPRSDICKMNLTTHSLPMVLCTAGFGPCLPSRVGHALDGGG
jgi:hypothetical protein